MDKEIKNIMLNKYFRVLFCAGNFFLIKFVLKIIAIIGATSPQNMRLPSPGIYRALRIKMLRTK